MTVNGTRCCAKCKTPYGHSVEAGRCCHPSAASVRQLEALKVRVRAEAEVARQARRERWSA